MHTLSATELLDVWERGEYQHPIDRAITLLSVTCPEKKPGELANLSIGQRDALLFSLRRLMLGPQMEAFSECPACKEQLEFTINTDELLNNCSISGDTEQSVNLDGYNIRLRLPNSVDIAEYINSGSADATQYLLQRCVLQVRRDKKEVALANVSDTTVSTLINRMVELDRLSEVQIALNCSACGHLWTMLLDILSFFWLELREQAKQLLNQVHILARSYGWREADILSMNARRRQHYLEMVTS
jgi:hypothetical protein